MAPVERVLVARFCELTGYTPRAIEGKIRTGAWVEGSEYSRAPDGHVMVILEGYNRWAAGLVPGAPAGEGRNPDRLPLARASLAP